jgi:hypothetical protein
MSDLPAVSVTAIPGRTRVIVSPKDQEALTNARITDVRTAVTRGLREYVEQLAINADGGREIRFAKVFEAYADAEVPATYPAAIVFASQPGTYDYKGFTPRTFDLPSGITVRSIAEFVQPIDLEVWSNDPRERTALVSMLEQALSPVDWMYGLRLELPHYFNARATYELTNMAYLDVGDDPQRRWRKASFSIIATCTQFKSLDARLPRLSVRVCVDVDEGGLAVAQARAAAESTQVPWSCPPSLPIPVVPVGPTGSAEITVVAGEPLGGHRVVVLLSGHAYHADPLNEEHRDAVVGITVGAISLGATGQVRLIGEITESSWSWVPGLPIFVGTMGVPTQVFDPARAWSRTIGIAKSATAMVVQIVAPIDMLGGGTVDPPAGVYPSHLYVSAITGNDLADGRTPTTAVASLVRAFELVPDVVTSPIVVHVGPYDLTATGAYAMPSVNRQALADLVIIGDGAGQLGGAGAAFSEVVPATSALASSTLVINGAGFDAAGAWRGYTVEILTGAAAGDRRLIADHTATSIIPSAPFTASIGAGDTWRIVRPSVRIDVPDAAGAGEVLLCSGYGTPDAQPSSETLGPTLYVVGVRFVVTAPSGSAGFSLRGSSTCFFGVEVEGITTPQVRLDGASLACGMSGVDSTRGVGVYGAPALLQSSPVSTTQWLGWGLASIGGNSGSATQTFSGGVFDGYVVSTRGLIFRDGMSLYVRGGSSCPIGAQAPCAVTNQCQGFVLAPAATLPFLIRGSASTGSGVYVQNGAKIGLGNVDVQLTLTGASAVAADSGGIIEYVGVTGACAGYGLLAAWGGAIHLFSLTAPTGTLGAASVENHSECDMSDLISNGDHFGGDSSAGLILRRI